MGVTDGAEEEEGAEVSMLSAGCSAEAEAEAEVEAVVEAEVEFEVEAEEGVVG